jgi:hypothetical protein
MAGKARWSQDQARVFFPSILYSTSLPFISLLDSERGCYPSTISSSDVCMSVSVSHNLPVSTNAPMFFPHTLLSPGSSSAASALTPHQNLYGRTCSIPNTANHYRHNYLSSPAPILVWRILVLSFAVIPGAAIWAASLPHRHPSPSVSPSSLCEPG